MLRVEDIMSRDVVTVNPAMSLREAAELFAERHIGGAPVVEGHRVVGVVSKSDILSFASSPSAALPRDVREDWSADGPGVWDEGDGASPFFAERWAFSDADAAGTFGDSSLPLGAMNDHTVGEVMTHGILSLPPGADVLTAAERMRAADVHRLLVMEHGELVGILSTTDLARAIADRRVGSRTYVFDRRH